MIIKIICRENGEPILDPEDGFHGMGVDLLKWVTEPISDFVLGNKYIVL